jgi:positive regulator of sigma E activity
MEETGTVISAKGDMAQVEIDPKEACCHCHVRMICRPQDDKRIVEATNRVGATVGQMVRIELNPRSSFVAVLLLFIGPVAALLIGYLAAIRIGTTEEIAHGAAFGVLVLYGLILLRLERMAARSGKYRPIVTEVIAQSAGDRSG